MTRAASFLSCLLLIVPLAGCADDEGSDDGADPTGVAGATGSTGDDGATTSPTDPGAATTNAGDPSSDGGPGPGTTDATDPGATTTGDDDTAGESTGQMQTPPPTGEAALLPWLEAGNYLSWTSESAVHDSQGPHFGNVRTYVNDALLDSLTAGDPTHPIDAAAVKELYGAGATVLGWSVIVKVADGEGGDTWYFLEHYDGTTYGDGVGDGSCIGCHSMGSVDYFKSPFPLQ